MEDEKREAESDQSRAAETTETEMVWSLAIWM